MKKTKDCLTKGKKCPAGTGHKFDKNAKFMTRPIKERTGNIMRLRIHTGVLSFVLMSGIFLLIFFCAQARAEENLRNYPAYVVIEDFDVAGTVNADFADEAGGGANIVIQKGFSSALPALLPKAKVVSVTLDYGPEMNEAKKRLKKYRQENDRRLKEGLPLLPWENMIPPEERERFKPLMMGDFLITGMLSKAGGRYYIVAKIITTASNSVGFRKVIDFGNLSELPGVVNKIAAQAANALKDSFYCVDTDPAELKLSADKTIAVLSARVVNLKNEPVDGERVNFKSAKPQHGNMQPDKAALNQGEAKSKYIVNERKSNSVKVSVKPKGPCGKGITNGLWVPVQVGFELYFKGDADAKVEIKESEASYDLSYKTHYTDGRAHLEIDEKTGNITGTGYCYREMEFGGTFGGDGVSGGQKGESVKERIEVELRGTVKGNAAELYIKLKPGKLDAKNRIEAHSESGSSEVDMTVSKDKVESTARANGAAFGPLIAALEAEKEYEIGPVKITLTSGKESEFEFTPPSPMPGISQHCKFIFKIAGEPVSK